MSNPILLQGIIELGKRFFTNKDHKEAFENEIEKAQLQLDQLLLTTTTTPKVDAFIKILYALERFTKSLWRPFGGACMTAFGIYAHYKGLPIDQATHLLLDGAFPAWGASRHMEKSRHLPEIQIEQSAAVHTAQRAQPNRRRK